MQNSINQVTKSTRNAVKASVMADNFDEWERDQQRTRKQNKDRSRRNKRNEKRNQEF
ncbi:hypothetical protein NVP1084O_230 [Vibrio phage 1.084.O._10N.261.49.F5]|nr:hypothetical protein NVP1084O_230 [Vibrio phage 1.084.O._10N.261.49.F5]